MFGAGGGLAHGATPRTRLRASLGGAVAAQPLSTDRPVQMDDPGAAGTGRTDDGACLDCAEPVDQPQHLPTAVASTDERGQPVTYEEEPCDVQHRLNAPVGVVGSDSAGSAVLLDTLVPLPICSKTRRS